MRRLPRAGLDEIPHASRAAYGRQLLLVALQDFLAQHAPDGLVQFHETRRRTHLGDVARARQVDREFADRVRGRPGAQADHAVAHRDRLVEVVGDEEHRLLLLGPERQDLVLHQLAGLDVEGRERFVHQDDVGVQDQGLRQADALAHAARELVRVAVAEAAEADALEPGLGLGAGIGDAAELEPRHHVLRRGAPGHQALGLEHVAGAPVHARERAAEHLDGAGARCDSRPAATLSRVLLPQPVGPTTETNSPAPTSGRRRAPRCSAGPGRPCRRRCRRRH